MAATVTDQNVLQSHWDYGDVQQVQSMPRIQSALSHWQVLHCLQLDQLDRAGSKTTEIITLPDTSWSTLGQPSSRQA